MKFLYRTFEPIGLQLGPGMNTDLCLRDLNPDGSSMDAVFEDDDG